MSDDRKQRQAERSRRHYERKKTGKVSVPVDVAPSTVAMLTMKGYLDPDRATSKAAIGKALNRLLEFNDPEAFETFDGSMSDSSTVTI